MADSQNTVELLIKFGIIDPEKAEAAKQALDDLNKKTNEATEATKENVKHLEGSGKVFASLNKLVPELGHALHAAFMGPLGPLILVGLAVAKVKAHLEDYNKELDRVSDAEVAAHQESIRMLQTAWDNAQTAMGEYRAALATAGDEKDAIGKQLANIKQITDAQIDSSKKVIEQLGKQEVAWLRAHGGTADQISAAEERTRSTSERLDSKKEAGSGVEGLVSEQAIRRDNNDLLIRRAEAAKAAAASADAALLNNQKEIADARARLDPTTEEGKKKAAEMEAASGNLARVQNIQNIAPTPAAKAALQTEVDAAKGELDRLTKLRELDERHIKRLESKEAELQQNKTVLETRAAQATGASTINQGRLRELPGEIDQAGKVQAERDHARDVINVLNSHGGKSNQALGDVATAIGLSERQKLEIANRIVNQVTTISQAWAGLDQRVSMLQGQMRSAGLSGR